MAEDDKYVLKEVHALTVQRYDEQIKELKADMAKLEQLIESKFAKFWAVLYTTLGALILNLIMLLVQRVKH